MKYSFALGLMLFITACQSTTQTETEQLINQYIRANNLKNVKITEGGVYYTILSKADGPSPDVSSYLAVTYKGSLLDGTVFDVNNTGVEFYLGNAIAGWQEGLQYFKQGETGILIIPPSLGFGEQEDDNLPPNSITVFEITLLDVGNPFPDSE